MLLLIKDWRKDLVYLVQIPRAGSIPSISPFCLKLETWIRMANIPYQNIDNEFKHNSLRGQIPFIEINGRQIADSNHIIQELTKMFHVQLDNHLNEEQRATMTAYHSLIEASIYWDYLYFRGMNNKWMATSDGVIGHFTGFKKFLFNNWVLGRLKKKHWNAAQAQGIGKDTPAEVVEKAKKNLKALSVFLGKKKFLMGDHASTIDATAFGHLCQIYFTPTNKELFHYMEADTRNLVDYLRNVRDEYWPDWHDATTQLSLQTKPRESSRNGLAMTAIDD